MLDYRTRTAGFESFTSMDDSSVRIFGPGASVAQDLEPVYITVSADSTTAWISLQENNALAILDVPSATIIAVKGLGFKNHAMFNAEFDVSEDYLSRFAKFMRLYYQIEVQQLAFDARVSR